MTSQTFKPTRAQLAGAGDRQVPDLIARDLRVLFVGINPGLYSAAIGHHFGRPGNRFWPALFAAGFTPRLLSPLEEGELLSLRLGITNFVARASARADELSREELREGASVLRAKLREFRPRAVAFLGVTAYRSAFDQPKAVTGQQPEPLEGVVAWVLPNPSGLNQSFRIDPYRDLQQWLARNERG